MAWLTRSAKPSAPPRGQTILLGLDLNATRARAASVQGGRLRAVLLDDPHEELPLAVNLDGRQPVVGRAGLSLVRKLPHMACVEFLPCIGTEREWRAGRHRLDANLAVGLVAEELARRCPKSDAAGLVVPGYLSLPQVAVVTTRLDKGRLPVRGSVTVPLALAADLGDPAGTFTGERLRVVDRDRPADRRPLPLTSVALVVDADDYALTAGAVVFEERNARLLASAAFPRLGLRFWRERLLDALADRCIRLCRRDPRDNAIAEQSLYEQIDDALERTRHGQRVNLTIRSAHWYQDLVQQPDDFGGFCAGLVKKSVGGVNQVLREAGDQPPEAVWVTHAAARLPGLVGALHQGMTERTRVLALPADAIARAAAGLADRWATGELPRVHIDTTIPLPAAPPRADQSEGPRVASRGHDAPAP